MIWNNYNNLNDEEFWTQNSWYPFSTNRKLKKALHITFYNNMIGSRLCSKFLLARDLWMGSLKAELALKFGPLMSLITPVTDKTRTKQPPFLLLWTSSTPQYLFATFANRNWPLLIRKALLSSAGMCMCIFDQMISGSVSLFNP